MYSEYIRIGCTDLISRRCRLELLFRLIDIDPEACQRFSGDSKYLRQRNKWLRTNTGNNTSRLFLEFEIHFQLQTMIGSMLASRSAPVNLFRPSLSGVLPVTRILRSEVSDGTTESSLQLGLSKAIRF